MGVDTGCMLILGLPADELKAGLGPELQAKIEELGFYDVVSEDGELGLQGASPYYDSDSGSRVWGVSLAREYWGAIEIKLDELQPKIDAARAEFKELTGLEGKLFVSPHVT